MASQPRAVLWLAAICVLVTLIGCTKEKKEKHEGKHVPVVVESFPSPAGVCTLNAENNCIPAQVVNSNTCKPGGPCNINLVINGDQVNLFLNGQAQALTGQQIVCVSKGDSLTWQVQSGSKLNFLADFGNADAFTDNQDLTWFSGGDSSPARHTTANYDGCYKYNIKVCPHPDNGSGSTPLKCGQSDPVVIVGSGSTLMTK